MTSHRVTWTRSDTLVAVLFVVWQFFYFGYSWAVASRTFGMYVLGLRVVRADGTEIVPRQGVVRALVFPLSFLLLGLGFLGILVQHEHRALHDLIAGTTVVYAWDARAARLRFLAREAEIGHRGPPRPASAGGAAPSVGNAAASAGGAAPSAGGAAAGGAVVPGPAADVPGPAADVRRRPAGPRSTATASPLATPSGTYSSRRCPARWKPAARAVALHRLLRPGPTFPFPWSPDAPRIMIPWHDGRHTEKRGGDTWRMSPRRCRARPVGARCRPSMAGGGSAGTVTRAAGTRLVGGAPAGQVPVQLA